MADLEEISANHPACKGFASKIYKEISKLSNTNKYFY